MKKNRILWAVLAALVLALAVLAVPTVRRFTAHAADTHADHCICGGDCAGVGDHVCSATAPTWTGVSQASDITGLSGIGEATASGSAEYWIYLKNDITLSANLSIYPNVSLHICLNGYTLFGPNNNRAIHTINGTAVKLTICDCSAEKTGTLQCRGSIGSSASNTLQGHGVLIYGKNSDFKLFGGTIRDGRTNYNYGANVAIGSSASFEMYGGAILDGRVMETCTGNPYGGNVGIGNGTTFTMYDGLISGGNGHKYGGNVGASSADTSTAKFIMNGGTIQNGIAQMGGNVLATDFTMNGGTIQGGTATKVGTSGGFGGNVAVRLNFTMNGGTVSDGMAIGNVGGNIAMWSPKGKFTMNGGLVSRGRSDANEVSGGVAAFYEATADGVITLNGGRIVDNFGGVQAYTGTVLVSGNPTVYDNDNNITATVPVKVTAPLTGGMLSFSVSPNAYVVESDADYSDYITNDCYTYRAFYDSAKKMHGFVLDAPNHEMSPDHCICCWDHYGEGGHICAPAEWTRWESTDSLPEAGGNYYLANDITLTAATAVSKDTVLCMNGHTIYGPAEVTVNAALTFTDCAKAEADHVQLIGKTVLTVSGPSSDVLFKAGTGSITTYDVIHTNSDKENAIGLLDPTGISTRKVDIYIIAGQSNASGSSSIVSARTGEHDFNIYKNVFYYELRHNTDGSVQRDLTSYEGVRQGMGYDEAHVGPELGMAEILEERYAGSGKKALILKSAAGGTSILMHQADDGTLLNAANYGTDTVTRFNDRGCWYPEALQSSAVKALGANRPTGFLTRELIDSVEDVYTELVAAGYQPENINFVSINWMQGETDRLSPNSYKTTFPLLAEEFRTKLSLVTGKDLSALPIVMGEICRSFTNAGASYISSNTAFINMQHELESIVPNLTVIPTADYEINKMINGVSVAVGTDTSHWNYRDILTVGQLFALGSLNEIEPNNETHEHCVCGGTADGIGDHTCTGTAVWTRAYSEADFTSLAGIGKALPSGTTSAEHYIYLGNDIALSGCLNLYTGVSLHICLNGHTLTGPNNARVFSTYSGKPASLTICDCSETATGTVQCVGTIGSSTNTLQGHLILLYNAGSEFTLYGGLLTGGRTANNFGGNVAVCSGTTFTMYGGEVADGEVLTPNSSTMNGSGGNVCLNGTGAAFYFYDGSISRGKSTSFGGNVAVGSNTVFVMTGGTIREGQSKWGGNIAYPQTTGGTYTISGGLIVYGEALNGSGGNIGVFDNTNLVIKNDTMIAYGKAKYNGGNINMNCSTETTSPTLTISDAVLIIGGEAGLTKDLYGNGGNICIGKSANLVMTGGTVSEGNAYIGGNIALCGIGTGKITVSGGEISEGSATANGWDVQNDTNGSGVVNITDGALIYNTLTHTGGGGVNTGTDAAVINITGGTVKDSIMATKGTVNISGGYISDVLVNYTYTYKYNITGGHFKKKPAADRMAEGYYPVDDYIEKDGVTYYYTVMKAYVITTFCTVNGEKSSVATVFGGGVYPEGSTPELYAESEINGYRFVAWKKDGVTVTSDAISTVGPIHADAEYEAVYEFGADTVHFHAEASGLTLKTASGEVLAENKRRFDGYLPVGTELILTFTYTDEEFQLWRNESYKLISRDAEYQFALNTETKLYSETNWKQTENTIVVFLSDKNQMLKRIDPVAAITANDIPSVPIRVGKTGGQWDKTLDEINAAIADPTVRYFETKVTGYVEETPIYAALTPAAVPTVKMTLTEKTEQADGKVTLSFGATRSVPTGFELIEQGLVFVTVPDGFGIIPEMYPIYGSESAVKYVSTGMLPDDITVLNVKNMRTGYTLLARGYVVYKDAAGALNVTHTELAIGTFEGITIPEE